MLDSIKNSAMKAADATQRGAGRAKHQAEVVMLEQKITSIKKDFGAKIYDAMVRSDREATQMLFNTTKQQVEALEGQIAAHREKIDSLKHTGGGGGGGPVPPPVGPPPGPPAGGGGLPAGWKSAATPEGKTYFYHEQTGETSWTTPQ